MMSDAAASNGVVGIPYSRQIDGLRAIAVGGVLYTHFWSTYSVAGNASVRLFFVISGYLITGVLVSARDARTKLLPMLGNFYARRVLRIFPAYYFVVFWAIALNLSHIRATALWHLFFATNMLFLTTNGWEPRVAVHLWSLGVEEQFYIIWPLIVLLTPRRWLGLVIVASIATCLAYKAWLITTFPDTDDTTLYVTMPTFLDCLGGGGLLAFSDIRGGVSKALTVAIGVAGIVCAPLLTGLLTFPTEFLQYVFGDTFAVFTFVALVKFASSESIAASAALGNIIIVYLGRRSYGIYLYHNVIYVALGSLKIPAVGHTGAINFIVCSALSVVAADVSWRFIERPALRLKTQFRYC
jgi:peptidoglycan/LPS O-acetylase OafA/YrhL